MAQVMRYGYVGPAQIRDQAVVLDVVAVQTRDVLDGWLAARERRELFEPFTFVVALDGVLRLAPRRSEHVALAAGRDVLAAGEMTFASTTAGWRVTATTVELRPGLTLVRLRPGTVEVGGAVARRRAANSA